MGIPRSGSPSTVSHGHEDGTEKNLNAISWNINRDSSHHRKIEEGGDSDESSSTTYTESEDESSLLKANLRSLLRKHNGCTKHQKVVEAINELSKKRHKTRCSELEWFTGDFFTLSSPSFPGRIKPLNSEDSDVIQYTLGRLSFNIFQPNDLVCTVTSIRNPVYPQDDKLGEGVFTYHFMIDLIIHTPDGDLEATLMNRGFCQQSEINDDRMVVTFTGGSLIPRKKTINDATMLKLWSNTFADAYKRAEKERSFFGWLYQYCLKLFLGLTLPSDSTDLHDHSFHFSMKRPPKGHYDVLYLDHDIRITKGNRGTTSILQRVAQDEFYQWPS